MAAVNEGGQMTHKSHKKKKRIRKGKHKRDTQEKRKEIGKREKDIRPIRIKCLQVD